MTLLVIESQVAINLIRHYKSACLRGIAKGKVHPITSHEDTQGEQRYGFTLSLTSAMRVGGRRQAPAALPQ